MSDSSPRSWLFFVVAELGGQHRQLAAAQRLGLDTHLSAVQGAIVVRAALRIVTILSDSSNRIAIQGELSLAAQAYTQKGLAPRRSEPLPLHRKPWDRAMREFPFISTCLMLGAGCDTDRVMNYETTSERLGLVYDDASLDYGMVVVDISDLDRVSYGIVAFMAWRKLITPVATPWPQDEVVVSYYEIVYEQEPTIEAERPRRPLSAVAYMDKVGYQDSWETKYAADFIQRLEKKPLVHIAALERRF